MSLLDGARRSDPSSGGFVRAICAAVLACVVGLPASGPAVQKPAARESRFIRWRPIGGRRQALRYRSTVKADSGDTGVVEATFDTRVDRVSINRVALEYTVRFTRALINGSDAKALFPEQKIKLVRTRSGAFVSYEPKGESSLPGSSYVQELLVYPAKPVRVGATWTHHYDADATERVNEVDITFTYQGAEVVGGSNCYRIAMAFRELDGSKTNRSTGVFWVAESDGSWVKLKLHQDYWSTLHNTEVHQDSEWDTVK